MTQQEYISEIAKYLTKDKMAEIIKDGIRRNAPPYWSELLCKCIDARGVSDLLTLLAKQYK
jgi:hypothetical protein